MKRLVPIVAAALLAAGCNPLTSEAPHTRPSPAIQLPVLPDRPGAGYFDIDVPPERGVLLSVTSPFAQRVEIHETMSSGSVSSMRPLARVQPENGRITFRQGGRHLMLYGVDPRLRPSIHSTVIFVLHFEHGQPVPLQGIAMAAGGEHESH